MSEDLRRMLAAVVDGQRAVAERYRGEPRFPEHVARDIAVAADAAERALAQADPSLQPAWYLTQVRALLAEAAARFAVEQRDVDGYGAATLEEIRRAVEALGDG